MVKEMPNLIHAHSFDHNSRSTNDNSVIPIGLESRLEEISNDRLHAPF